MRSIAIAAVAAVAGLFSIGAQAQAMKPGLWEINSRMQGAMGGQMAQAQSQLQEQLRNMPPEQRKMVEEMMAKQGARMAPSSGGGMAIQMCITREMAARNEVPMDPNRDCRTTTQQRSGNTVKVAFSCSQPPSTGEAQVTFSGSDAYTSKVRVNTAVEGRPQTIDMESDGRWLAADCGSVKPPGAASR